MKLGNQKFFETSPEFRYLLEGLGGGRKIAAKRRFDVRTPKWAGIMGSFPVRFSRAPPLSRWIWLRRWKIRLWYPNQDLDLPRLRLAMPRRRLFERYHFGELIATSWERSKHKRRCRYYKLKPLSLVFDHKTAPCICCVLTDDGKKERMGMGKRRKKRKRKRWF